LLHYFASEKRQRIRNYNNTPVREEVAEELLEKLLRKFVGRLGYRPLLFKLEKLIPSQSIAREITFSGVSFHMVFDVKYLRGECVRRITLLRGGPDWTISNTTETMRDVAIRVAWSGISRSETHLVVGSPNAMKTLIGVIEKVIERAKAVDVKKTLLKKVARETGCGIAPIYKVPRDG